MSNIRCIPNAHLNKRRMSDWYYKVTNQSSFIWRRLNTNYRPCLVHFIIPRGLPDTLVAWPFFFGRSVMDCCAVKLNRIATRIRFVSQHQGPRESELEPCTLNQWLNGSKLLYFHARLMVTWRFVWWICGNRLKGMNRSVITMLISLDHLNTITRFCSLGAGQYC